MDSPADLTNSSHEACDKPNKPSATAIAITSQLPYVLVPPKWTRTVSEQGAVFYVSPSGRVLLSRNEVQEYIREEHSCKCYLDRNLRFEEVFSFDPSFASLFLPPCRINNHTVSECESFWTRNLSGKSAEQQLDTLMSFAEAYLTGTQVVKNDQLEKDKDSVYSMMVFLLKQGTENAEMNATLSDDAWLATFDLDDFILTWDGLIYPRGMSRDQFKHLACELIIKMTIQFNIREPFFIITSGIESKVLLKGQKRFRKTSGEPKKKKKAKKILSQEEIEQQRIKKRAYKRDYDLRKREMKTLEEKAEPYKRKFTAKQKVEKQKQRELDKLPTNREQAKTNAATKSAAMSRRPVYTANELNKALSILTIEHDQLGESCYKPPTGMDIYN